MSMSFNEDIACFVEGSSEKAIMDLLIDNDCLAFTRDNLADEQFLSMQEISKKNIDQFSQRILSQVNRDDKMDIIIVQDRDIFSKFPSIYQEKIGNIYVVQTKPEIEMLMIHAEGLFSEYQKVKSKQTPKAFLSNELKLPEKTITSYKYLQNYFTPDSLILAILSHSQAARNSKDILQLRDLLKEVRL